MPARLYCILARESSAAVIFRRGPSNLVRLISWNRKNDSFEPGQWFKGRIYERRCDLSPDGRYLAYFAATYKAPLASWTAISRPPFFTALALWQKGDGWGGGGLFASERKFLLNHRADQCKLHKDFSVPRKLRVELLGERPGWGEDNPIWEMRLLRDGWEIKNTDSRVAPNWGAEVVWNFEANPVVYERVSFPRSNTLLLRAKITGIKKRGGPWYLMDHDVIDRDGKLIGSFPESDWADWDNNGDLLLAQDGKLFRAKRGGSSGSRLDAPKEIADFNSMRFEQIVSPARARGWRFSS